MRTGVDKGSSTGGISLPVLPEAPVTRGEFQEFRGEVQREFQDFRGEVQREFRGHFDGVFERFLAWKAENAAILMGLQRIEEMIRDKKPGEG